MLYILVAELVIYLSILTILSSHHENMYVSAKITYDKMNILYKKESDIKSALEYYIIDNGIATSNINDLIANGKLPVGYSGSNYFGGTVFFEVASPYYVKLCENFASNEYKNIYLNYYKFNEGFAPAEDISGTLCPQPGSLYRYVQLRPEATNLLR